MWSYTHAWRDVPRDAWGDVNVLASLESSTDALHAVARGYAPAMVVDEHPADGRAYVRDGVRWIPCPNQTRGKTCTECMLCLDTSALASRGAGIAFAVHGEKRRVALKVLPPTAEAT